MSHSPDDKPVPTSREAVDLEAASRELRKEPLDAPPTAPLGKSASTRPLGDTLALRTELEVLLARAGRVLGKLEGRIELLVHAANLAELPLHGVGNWEFRHPMTPQGREIVAILALQLRQSPELGRKVQVAVFRYLEAGQGADAARAATRAGLGARAAIEGLRMKFFYLNNYHREFSADPLLSQLFPGPSAEDLQRAEEQADTPAAGPVEAAPPLPKGTGLMRPPGPPPRASSAPIAGSASSPLSRYRQGRDAVVQKAEELVAAVGPVAERARRLRALSQQSAAQGLFGRLNPFEDKERQLATRLKTPVLQHQLEELGVLFELATEQLASVKGGSPYEALQQTCTRLSGVLASWSQHAVLKELVSPQGPKPGPGR